MTYAAYLETDEDQYMVTSDTWEDVLASMLQDDFEEGDELHVRDVFVVDSEQRRVDLEDELLEAVEEFKKAKYKQQENV